MICYEYAVKTAKKIRVLWHNKLREIYISLTTCSGRALILSVYRISKVDIILCETSGLIRANPVGEKKFQGKDANRFQGY